jgi:hypothetical protein
MLVGVPARVIVQLPLLLADGAHVEQYATPGISRE